ncbi:hypothetical protein VIMY103929_20915 [Vibrio mytili]
MSYNDMSQIGYVVSLEGTKIRVNLLDSHCSGQLKLATVLEFFQYSRSDSLGVRPPLY